ncbi:type II secretion system protein [Silanimonas sp.]|uniref:PulJ/GspJ family protein n=1 Tax=Silanimonas sp. TaxID=1929290 RepID=UPI001BC537D5|nr:type II secretion system protein [Silanimonas sp.]MBS3896311.1 prepilin-type N-terminal cleavage/methylation domain-containing protein [Silanimonas sp.]
MARRAPKARLSRGLSLIEMVTVIVVLAVLGLVTAAILRQPIEASADVQRRAQLADNADQVMARMARDLRLALPNSIRASPDGRAIELLLAPSAGRYRAVAASVAAGPETTDTLDFSTADTSFALMAPLTEAPLAGQWAVVYNLSAEGDQANAWAGDNRATVGAGSTPTRVVLAPGFRFPFASPSQRVYFVSQAVQYRCGADGLLHRHAAYAPTAAMQVPPPGSASVMAEGVNLCVFSTLAGDASRQGLATLQLGLSREGETLSLLRSVHLPNQP